jgi:hypothetical protein
VGVSAISASVLPIADSSARRWRPATNAGIEEYFRTVIATPKWVSALCTVHSAMGFSNFRSFRNFRYRIGRFSQTLQE